MTGGREKVGRPGGVDLWVMRLDPPEADVAACWEALSAPERERAARLSRAEVRRRFVVARGGLRHVLAAHLAAPARSLAFEPGLHGKPMLPGGPRFSLSHSGDLALCAVAQEREVGVDVERLRPIPEADDIARRWFAEDDLAAYRTARGARRESVFLLLWTRREAWLKAIGLGLSDGSARTPIDTGRWELHDLFPDEAFVGALAVERVPEPADSASPPGPAGR